MFLRISDKACRWLENVNQASHWPDYQYFYGSKVGLYHHAVSKVNEAHTSIAKLSALTQESYVPTGIFRIKIFGIVLEPMWRANLKQALNYSEGIIATYEPMVNNTLNRFACHTFELGQALDRWLKLYNHLVEGQRLCQLSDEQVVSVQGALPILKHALEYFERCVSLHQWHTAHGQMKGVQPVAPTVGLQLEELQEVITCLTACVSDDTLDNASTMIEREVALVELQKQLGTIPGLSLSVV